MSAASLPLISNAPLDATFAWRDGQTLSRADFLADVTALAARLPARGYAINLCEDRYTFTVAFCAALLRGQTNLLPPNRSPGVVAEVAARHTDHYLLDEGQSPARTAQQLPQLCDAEWFDCRAGNDAPATTDGEIPSIPAAQVAAIVFTSGSTGTPCAHAKRWDELVALTTLKRAYLQRQHGQLSGLLATVPPQHMFGLETSVLLPLHSALPLHSGRPLFPEDVRQALAACGPAPLLVTTPIHLRALTRAQLDYPPCGLMLSATAPLDAELAQAAETQLGCPLHEIYGSTETGAVAGRRSVEGPLWRPYPGIQLKRDDSGITQLHADYLPTSRPLGDLIELAEDGRFQLLGRLDDALNIAGKRASLGDLNRRLLAIPGVDDGVIFVPDERDASSLRLGAIVVAPELDAAAITSALRTSVDPAFLPRTIRFVERLPRSETGKLRREAIHACWHAGIGQL